MKCFVHVGFDPQPKEAEDPVEAINIAERYLLSENKMPVRWRRDDLYPDNFLEYTKDELLLHLSQKGEIVLQLAELGPNGLPIMGEIVNIFTAFEEEKNAQEANQALKASEQPNLRKGTRYESGRLCNVQSLTGKSNC